MYFSDINYIHSVVQPPPKLFCNGHPCCSRYQNSIPFHSCILFHHLYMPHFLYPFIHPWTLGLLPSFDYCEQCFCECWCTNICLHVCFEFFWEYTQEGNSWITWSFCVSFFSEELTYCFPQQPPHFTFPPAKHKGSKFSISSPACFLCVCVFLINSLTNEYEPSPCGFDLHFPNG